MANLKICRICLQTETKNYSYVQYQLKSYYEEILALKLSEMDSLPQYFCFQCAILLHKYHKFKEKCHFGQKILQEILWKGPITYETVKMIDRTNLNLLHKSPQQKVIFINASENEIHPIDNITIKEEDKNESATEKIEIVDDNKNLDDDDNFEIAFDDNREIDVSVTETSSPVLKKTKNKIKDKTKVLKAKVRECKVKRKNNNVKDKNSNNKSDQNKEKVVKRLILMDASKWKKFDLTEEDAIQEFRAKSYDEKYTAAAYKCTDCLKGFSEEDMLKRHIKIRHSESQGSIECQFCRMRFKRKCRLRQHIREHYTKFKCLRCNFICVLESTALSHEQFHNGVTRKCKYCGKEFRYSSTYYTHLRTHRSQFVCTLCGSSFVSEAGLHQHKRVKHCTSDKSLEKEDKEEEEANKFCSRCNILFETTKAYEEHLYHSTLHADENGTDIDVTKTLNILERATQEKVTSLFKRRKIDDISFKSGKRCKKPTTCHQCGKHFSTQSACMKHHLEEHPGTSFCPPNLRHICEICGASLAPGSVAVHKNMHTREKIFSCATCGRQFYESVGLKRHMLTHTGEKPFACTSCDKRFTQSASLKLHYRTFHLKQPYPKRNRRKKE